MGALPGVLRELSELVGDYDKHTSSVSYNRGFRSTDHQLRRERITQQIAVPVDTIP